MKRKAREASEGTEVRRECSHGPQIGPSIKRSKAPEAPEIDPKFRKP
jgi:hypothetical protein